MPMPKSKCRYCRPAVLFLDDEKVAEGCVCLLEEWDEETSCRKGYCRYYRRAPVMQGGPAAVQGEVEKS